jgi:hypothetical protein
MKNLMNALRDFFVSLMKRKVILTPFDFNLEGLI